MSDLTGQTLGRYKVIGQLGSGGMSRVYKADQPALNRQVALKVLHSHLANEADFVTRFEREAAAIAQLRHPNITQVFDYHHDPIQDLYYMVMEFVDGPTLKDEIEKRQAQNERFELSEVVQIFTSLASAVDYAHAQSMIHRDIKPANIMFTKGGQVVLADFGLARIANESQVSTAGIIAGTPHYMAPEQAQGERTDSRTDTYALGVVLYELVTMTLPFDGSSTHSILLKHITEAPPAPTELDQRIPLDVESVIFKALEKNPDDRYQTANEMLHDLRYAAGISFIGWGDPSLSGTGSTTLHPEFRMQTLRSAVIPDSPYQGLYAFKEDDAEFFFGREKVIEQLIAKVKTNSFVTLLGASGSGKSSVVFAGLVPHLRPQPNWLIADMRPGARPFHTLAAALLPLLEENVKELDTLIEIRRLAELLQSGDMPLHDIVQRVVNKQHSHKLLLIIDQFEELYTLNTDQTRRIQFLNLLVKSTTLLDGNSPLHIIATLRADFLGQLLDYRPLADALQQGSQMLGPMTQDELHQAVEQPALKQDVSFEEGLVERILEDVGEEPGNLPLLEFALTTLWERQEFYQLTHTAYEAIGYVEGALTRYADETFAELSANEKQQARLVFTQMVQPGEGTEDTRRIATRPEIGEANWTLVQKLADARLVVTNLDPDGIETAEVVHEALIRSWRRLRNWMSHDRTFRAWQERLRNALLQWSESGRDTGALLRGAPLAEAEGWYHERTTDLVDLEQEFIRQSIELRDTERRQQEQEQRTRERLRRLLTIVSVIGAVLAIGLSVWALTQRNAALAAQVVAENAREAANRQRTVAENAQATAEAERALLQASLSQQIAIQSSLSLETELDLASLLAVEALRISNTLDAQTALLNSVLAQPELVRFLDGHQDRVQTIAYSPDGTLIATGGSDNTIILWEADTGRMINTLNGHMSIVSTVTFSPDGRWLVSGGNDRQVIIWDIEDQQLEQQLENEHEGIILAMAFSPDSRLLATSSTTGELFLWNTDDWQLVETFAAHENEVFGLAFHPNGRLLASAGNDERILLWDVNMGQQTATWETSLTEDVSGLSFSPDGTFLAAGTRANVIQIWDTATESIVETLTAHENWITALAFQPQGNVLASADRDGRVLLWETDGWRGREEPLAQHGAWVSGLAFHPNGRFLASSSYNQQGFVWQLAESENEVIPPAIATRYEEHTDWVQDTAYSPDGRLLASAGRDGRVVLWDTATMSVQQSIEHGAPVRAVTFSPDNQLLAYGSEDGSITFWNLTTNQRLGSNTSHTDFVQDIAFNPDGTLLASASDDNTVIIWDVAKIEPLLEPLTGHDGFVWDVAFSPDGRLLLSSGRDGQIILWSTDTFAPLDTTLGAHTQSVNAIAFNHNGTRLASGSGDRTIIIWNTSTWEPEHTLTEHESGIQSVAFSPDGTQLLSSGDDNMILLWDVATGQRIGTEGPPLVAHTDRVSSLSYRPDGVFFVSGGRDGHLQLWHATIEGWQAAVCGRVNRNLTTEEWQQYFGSQTYLNTCLP